MSVPATAAAAAAAAAARLQADSPAKGAVGATDSCGAGQQQQQQAHGHQDHSQQHHQKQQQQQHHHHHQQQQQQWQRPPELQLPAGMPWHVLPPAGSTTGAASTLLGGPSSRDAAAAAAVKRQAGSDAAGAARSAPRRGACLPGGQHRNSSHGGNDQAQHLPSFLEWLSQLHPADSPAAAAAAGTGPADLAACVLAATAPGGPLAQLAAVDWDADPRVTFARFLADAGNSSSRSSSQSGDAGAAAAACPSCSLGQQQPDAWRQQSSRHAAPARLPGSQQPALPAAAAVAAPAANQEQHGVVFSETGTWGSDCD